MTEEKLQKLRDILADMNKREVIGKEICPATCNSAQDYDQMYHDVKFLKHEHTTSSQFKKKNPIMIVFGFRYAPTVAYILYRFLEEGKNEQDQ